MRRFRVCLGVQVPGKDTSEEIVEMPDNATDEECEEACRDCLDTMISNNLDTGWSEIDRAPKPAKKGRKSTR